MNRANRNIKDIFTVSLGMKIDSVKVSIGYSYYMNQKPVQQTLMIFIVAVNDGPIFSPKASKSSKICCLLIFKYLRAM